jgi:hypothetical protein
MLSWLIEEGDVALLSQFDFLSARYPFDDCRMKEFFEATAYVNSLAEAHPGFVWRLREDDWPAIRRYWGDTAVVTLSVWKDVDNLKDFLFRTPHRKYMSRGSEWFERPNRARVVLWWSPDDHRPSLVEAKVKLELLDSVGASPDAFDLQTSFSSRL